MNSDEPIRRLPGYDLLERVAVGGRGEIFLARETGGEERLVAVKLLRSEDVGRADRVQAFHDEVELSCLLVHPNVVRVYHGDVAPDGVPFLVMEFVDGITVWELLDRAKARGQHIPLGVAAYITAMIAEALAYAHSMTSGEGKPLNLVHRDVSTVNVMATFDGAIKLLDFGIARSAIRNLRTAPGIIKGKLDYLSPEQCTGGTIDSLTDIYSLGVVLFELLTRQRPFSESEVGVLFEKVPKGDRPKVHEVRPDVSPRLERIVDRAMAVARSARYQSAAEMLDDLRACMARLPDVPTSSGLAALVSDLAPDRVSAVQSSYGPPDTTAVENVADLGAAMIAAVDRAAESPSSDLSGSSLDGTVDDGPTKLDVPLLPDGPRPAASPAPPEPEGPPPTAPPLQGRAPRQGAGISPKIFLAGVLGLSLVAVCSGVIVTGAVRGGGAADRDGAIAQVPTVPDVPIPVPVEPPPAPDVAPPPPLPPPPLPATDGGSETPAVEPDGSAAGQGDAGSMDWSDGASASSDIPAGKGLLFVKSRRRVMLFLGRRKVGLTPVEGLAIEPGRYRLKVRGRHGVRRKRVRIREGEVTRVEFRL